MEPQRKNIAAFFVKFPELANGLRAYMAGSFAIAIRAPADSLAGIPITALEAEPIFAHKTLLVGGMGS